MYLQSNLKALIGTECYQIGIFIRRAPDVLPYKSAILSKQKSQQQTEWKECEGKKDERNGWEAWGEGWVSAGPEGVTPCQAGVWGRKWVLAPDKSEIPPDQGLNWGWGSKLFFNILHLILYILVCSSGDSPSCHIWVWVNWKIRVVIPPLLPHNLEAIVKNPSVASSFGFSSSYCW